MTEVMSDWDQHMDELETPTPASLVCVVCRFLVEQDDVALPLIHGVVCRGCRARVMGEPQNTVPKAMRRDIENLLSGKG